MKTISKKIFIYVLCGLLSVSACSCNYMRSVYALEYVGGALAFEEALKWLLGAIGIVSAGGMTADYWENHGQDFEDYCAQQNITNAEVADWQIKLCTGVLDKTSSCWSAFKNWAFNLVSSDSGGSDFVNIGLSPNMTSNQIISILNQVYSSNISNINDSTVYAFIYSVSNGQVDFIYFGWSDTTYSYNYNITNSVSVPGVSAGAMWYGSNNRWNTWSSTSNLAFGIGDNTNTFISSTFDITAINNVQVVNYSTTGDVSNNDVVGLQDVTTENLNVINSDTVDETNPEVAIPLPGLGASDDTISSDTYDEIVDGINDGTISLDDGIAQIQELLRVIVYDDTTDEVIPFQPDPDTGDNKTKDDVIQENKSNMGFTLFGLENVFPFCIPWDIYAFLSVLNAEPVAPVFNIPFPNVNDLAHPLTVRVDLSDWDNAARIVRLAEDFLFIVGLAFLTRSMIGAGGDD